MVESLKTVTKGRVGRLILSTSGLEACRQLIGVLQCSSGEPPEIAFAMLLAAIGRRVRGKKYLNSWAFVVPEIAAAMGAGDFSGLKDEATHPLLINDGQRNEAQGELKRSDLSEILSSQLLNGSNIDPYLRMVHQHGYLATEVVKAALTKNMIDGDKPKGAIRTWRYFERAIRNAATIETARAQGFGPAAIRMALKEI